MIVLIAMRGKHEPAARPNSRWSRSRTRCPRPAPPRLLPEPGSDTATPTETAGSDVAATTTETATSEPTTPPTTPTTPTTTPPTRTTTTTATTRTSPTGTGRRTTTGTGRTSTTTGRTRTGTETAAPTTRTPSAEVIASARKEYNVGNSKLFKGDYNGAIASYRQALVLYPGFAAGHKGIGLAYEKLGNKAKAVQAIRTYLSAAPGASDARQIRERIAALSGS